MRGIIPLFDSTAFIGIDAWRLEAKGIRINLYANNSVIMRYNAKTGGKVG
ncbi:MAG: hypothetical protein ACP5TI_00710 [Thermoprotei archaeon]